MKLKSITLLLIFVLAVVLYIACDKSPVDSQDDPPETELISLNRGDWTKSSKPVGLEPDDPRGKMIWYNPYSMIATEEIWDKDIEAGESATNTFWMEYSPSDTGTVSGSWAGIMQDISVALVPDDTVQFLEFRIYGNSGVIHVDIGFISEDINGNGLLDTEDKPDPISMMVNGIIDEGEDVGRDGLFDIEEPGYHPTNNPDPNGDNWYYNGYGIIGDNDDGGVYDYSHINGTEGNAIDPAKYGRPDTEDLDREGDLDILNSYVSYKIDLDNSGFLVSGSDYNGWKTYRIPLNDSLIADTIINSGDFPFPIGSNLRTIRMWLESENDEPFEIGIASADLLGYKRPGPKGFIPKELFIRDYQYAYGRIFDLGRMVSNHDEPSEYDFFYGDSIISIDLYKRALIGSAIDMAAPTADFYVDLNDTTNYDTENGFYNVHLVDPSVYVIHPTEHWILFNSPNGGTTDGLLGYFMIVKSANGTIDTVGSVIEEPYSLKLIKSSSPLQSFVSWDYEWRNVYSIPRHIDLNSLAINIYKGGPGTEPYNENLDHQDGFKYIQILGLDLYDRNGAATPDGLVDIYSPILDAYRGLLIFPRRKPFASDYSFGNAPLLDPQFPEIYNLHYYHSDLPKHSRYYIQVIYFIYDYLK